MTYTTLITPATLQGHLNDPTFVIVDCRFDLKAPAAGRAAYADAHIPGARYAHLDEDLSAPIQPGTGRHPLPAPEQLAAKLGAWGISNQSQVVAYDDAGGAYAARLWWLLRWLGHHNVAVLDGGWQAWHSTELPVTKDMPHCKPTQFVARVNNQLWVDAATVERIRTDNDYCLLDARAPERYAGSVESIDKVAGHIPGARNAPFAVHLNKDGTFKSAAELRTLYTPLLPKHGADHVVAMCGSGVTACHTLLALEHAGLPGATLYAGSWSEWIMDPRRAVATGGS